MSAHQVREVWRKKKLEKVENNCVCLMDEFVCLLLFELCGYQAKKNNARYSQRKLISNCPTCALSPHCILFKLVLSSAGISFVRSLACSLGCSLGWRARDLNLDTTNNGPTFSAVSFFCSLHCSLTCDCLCVCVWAVPPVCVCAGKR